MARAEWTEEDSATFLKNARVRMNHRRRKTNLHGSKMHEMLEVVAVQLNPV
eukprot:CAMPEP_0113947870 /NCGR_PEP_ID=MMETSP1339-20121228/67210_1 /TAXON_ID=94617 /ORGANISM="Fibrocapsa japonica" /LENGTH=50 /DNA_ID=CAMNT_0000954663 /DNA_START=52 /DNA_END=200 /DNA_ORIENTATION=+ /assembly_acc=CAM_ASM_000762